MKKKSKDTETIAATTIAIVATLSLLLLTMLSCRMYQKNYLEEIPIPEIEIDTIDTGQWEDPIPQQ